MNGSTTTYQYDSANKMTSPGTFTYDDKGNTLTHVVGGVTTTYTWDYLNRMTEWAKTNETTQDYAYNADGMRVSMEPENGTATDFLLDGIEVAEEIKGNSVTSYVAPKLVSSICGNTRTVYHADGLGSTRAMSDGSQVVAEAEINDAYGNVAASYGTAPNFGYAGQHRYYAEASGLTYLKARYYDPVAGRFISRDPIGYFGGRNLYRYVLNSPAMNIDPTGLTCQSTTTYSPWKTFFSSAHYESITFRNGSIGGPGGGEIGVGNGGAVGVVGEQLICSVDVDYRVHKWYNSVRTVTTCKRCTPCLQSTCWTKTEDFQWDRFVNYTVHKEWSAGSPGYDPNAGGLNYAADCAGGYPGEAAAGENSGEDYGAIYSQ